MTTTIYTDGACSGVLGGWAWYVDDHMWRSGAVEPATNNQMEMLAVVEALSWATISHVGQLLIVSDSAYVVNCFADRWYARWRQNGWRTSTQKKVMNRDLWERMLDLYEGYRDPITFRHCRGHGKGGIGDSLHVEGNRQADRLAVNARLTLVRDR